MKENTHTFTEEENAQLIEKIKSGITSYSAALMMGKSIVATYKQIVYLQKEKGIDLGIDLLN